MKLFPEFKDSKNSKPTTTFFYFLKLKATDPNGDKLRAALNQFNAKCEYWLECEYAFIGPESEYWSHAAIIEFSDIESVTSAFEQNLDSDHIEAIQGFAVRRTVIPSFILTLFKLLRPIGSLYLKKNHSVDLEAQANELNIAAHIGPNQNQVKRHLSNNSASGAYMINLLQSYKRAQYPDGDRGISGATAYYRRYGMVATRSVIMLGGELILSGRMGSPIVEHNAPPVTAGPWEGIGIMMYPDPSKIFSLKDMPGYSKALEHRTAGLKKTANIISKNA